MHGRNVSKREKKMETEENLKNIVARKINNYAVHQSKAFWSDLGYLLLRILWDSRKKIENGELRFL